MLPIERSPNTRRGRVSKRVGLLSMQAVARAVNTDLKRALSVAAACCCLGACALGPEYRRPEMDIPSTFSAAPSWQGVAASQSEPQSVHASERPWWLDWHDDALASLEEAALAANQTLARARTNVERSRFVAAQTLAELMPTLQLGVDATRSRVADYQYTRGTYVHYTQPEARAAVQMRWELDFWGKGRRTYEAASARQSEAQAVARAVRLAVTAEVATDYLRVRKDDLELAALHTQRERMAELSEETASAQLLGLATRDDVLAARDRIARIDVLLTRVRTDRAAAEHAIAVLLGLPAENFALQPVDDYRFALPPVEPTIPSRLLERRPDLIAAEANAMAATAEIGVAKADLFPDFLLNTGAGGAAGTVAAALEATARIWTLGAAAAVSVFDAGRRAAKLHAAQSTRDIAVAAYRETFLEALADVEDMLTQQAESDKAEQAMREHLASVSEIQRDAQRQREAGLAARAQVLEADIARLEAARVWSVSAAAASESRVGLVKALGGAWTSASIH